MRLERVAQLLETDGESASETAYGVCSQSVAHFSNRFRDHFKVHPSMSTCGRAAAARAGRRSGGPPVSMVRRGPLWAWRCLRG
jgi:AraC-like DNA-binding protein